MNNIFKLILAAVTVLTCVSTNVTAPQFEPPTIPAVEPTTVPTEPIEVPTEPVYEDIDIPPMIVLPEIESLQTIYDVEEAITECTAAIAEYETVLSTIPPEHPQHEDVFLLKMMLINAIDEYSEVLDAHWKSREEDRPVMTHIWRALKEYGYSDAVVAGIIGNLIAETGGMGYQDIEWDIKANGYYGVCMWALKYVPQIDGASLDEQLEYLVRSMEREMNTVYSKSFRKKFGVLDLRYKDFVELDNPYDAAIAFGVCYERCSAKHIQRRGPQAEKAYNYYIYLNTWPWPGK